MNLCVFIRPGVSPADRGEIEDAILDALGAGVELVGGGTFFGEVIESDFQLSVPEEREIDGVVSTCRRVLQGLVFSQPTELRLTVDAQEFPVEAVVRPPERSAAT